MDVPDVNRFDGVEDSSSAPYVDSVFTTGADLVELACISDPGGICESPVLAVALKPGEVVYGKPTADGSWSNPGDAWSCTQPFPEASRLLAASPVKAGWPQSDEEKCAILVAYEQSDGSQYLRAIDFYSVDDSCNTAPSFGAPTALPEELGELTTLVASNDSTLGMLWFADAPCNECNRTILLGDDLGQIFISTQNLQLQQAATGNPWLAVDSSGLPAGQAIIELAHGSAEDHIKPVFALTANGVFRAP